MKKFFALLLGLLLIGGDAGAQNYLRDDGTFPNEIKNFGSGAGTERLRIDNVGISTFNFGLTSANNIVIAASNANTFSFYSQAYGANTSPAQIGFLKSRGTTIGSFGQVLSGDLIGLLGFNATDGTQALQSAAIVVTAE